MSDPTRLSAHTIEEYFNASVPVALRLPGDPARLLRIDPPAQRIELWTPVDGPAPDVIRLARVAAHRDTFENVPYHVLALDARGARYEAYTVLAAIIDDLEAGRSLSVATARSLETYGGLLERRPRMTEETSLGLIGELLVLEHLVGTLGEQAAVTAWLGPGREEHDFVLYNLDAEVKTTLSERRSHTISSETQLQLSPGRPLWLVSLQLTRAGAAAEGFGVPDTIQRIRALLPVAGGTVNAHLRSVGWHDEAADLYSERYIWRTRPAAYAVDSRFPAITRARLDSVVPQPEFVGHVSYRVDVTSLAPGLPPQPLGDFVRELP